MTSNQFAIVPCSVCPGRTLLKTALTWKDSVFCSADCLRNHIQNIRLNNEPARKGHQDKFLKPALQDEFLKSALQDKFLKPVL
jgi:hypothetical protein